MFYEETYSELINNDEDRRASSSKRRRSECISDLWIQNACIFWFSSEPLCKSSDVVNAVAKLSKAKHLLDVEDLPGIIKRLDQYDEFFPAFQTLVSELKRILRVQEMDEILTAVTALVKFPHY
ncbi:PREDICTED: centrosomal protein of 70 kDa-like [Acropora digitifera]|uniref:centrosomal protein of 70 kDa-like n=1 Tax=Acropora digitifera TaxID=70779 RepID=UPI000779F9B4|nr:PREDICTED: centrosomal protein of 70 kDa-like [Acropora digitifera]